MFTDEEIAHITDVKQRIKSKLASVFAGPWSSVYLPWEKVFLSGGAIASLIQGEEPKDWDFYFEDLNAMGKFYEDIKSNHMSSVKDVDPKYKEFVGQDGKMITANAITMKDMTSFIVMIAMDPLHLKKTFDYKHCTAHFSLRDDKLYISPEVYRAAKNKKLIVNNQLAVKPWREEKFLSRGYSYSKP